jgi:anti-sigma factor RsiW
MTQRHDIKAYLDGELSGDRAMSVAESLRTDKAARAEADDYRAISTTLRLAANQDDVTGLERTLRALTQPHPKVAPLPWFFRPAFVFSFGGAVIVIAVAIMFPMFSSVLESAKNPGVIAEQSSAVPGAADANAAVAPAAATSSPVAMAPGEVAQMKAPMSATRAAEAQSMYIDRAKNPILSAAPAVPLIQAPVGEPRASGRLVVRTGSLGVYAKDLNQGFVTVSALAKGYGGYVESSSIQGADAVSMTIRIPVNRFDDATQAISRLGKLYQEQINGEDVTGAVVDDEARLKTLRVEESDLQELLSHAHSIGEILEIRDRITDVRSRIETIDAERQNLRGQSEMSSLSVTFMHEPIGVGASSPTPPSSTAWLTGGWSRASARTTGVLRFLVLIFVNILTSLPITLPVGLLTWWGWRKVKNSRAY